MGKQSLSRVGWLVEFTLLPSRRWPGRERLVSLNAVVAIVGFLVLFCRVSVHANQVSPQDETAETVGRFDDKVVTPVNQIVTPAGIQVDLPELRPQALALSPNGMLLVTSGKTSDLLVIDPQSGRILQKVMFPLEERSAKGPTSTHILKPDEAGQLSFTGLIFSPDGKRIYLSNVEGSINVFEVAPTGLVAKLHSFLLPPAAAPHRKIEIPAGLCMSKDGKRLYVALNLSNRVGEMDPETGKVLRTWDVGVEPYDVVLARNKLYVSNWAGRRPDASSVTGPAGKGTLVRVDPTRFIASEGSVSVIDLTAGTVLNELLTGLHASGLAVSPNGRYVVVANAGSDTLSVIDTKSDQIIEKIWTRQNPGDLFGAAPNALAFDASGKKLFVCNGTQNAVAEITFSPGESKLAGLIPVGWYPAAIVTDTKRKSFCVANIKGIGGGEKRSNKGARYNSHQWHGSVSIVPEPDSKRLAPFSINSLVN